MKTKQNKTSFPQCDIIQSHDFKSPLKLVTPKFISSTLTDFSKTELSIQFSLSQKVVSSFTLLLRAPNLVSSLTLSVSHPIFDPFAILTASFQNIFGNRTCHLLHCYRVSPSHQHFSTRLTSVVIFWRKLLGLGSKWNHSHENKTIYTWQFL